MNVRSAIFHRNYDRYSGGHQKVMDYFEHCVVHKYIEPSIYWSPDSQPLAESPWSVYADRVVEKYEPAVADLIFLAGVDWRAYLACSADRGRPIINLIQHVRHADPAANVYPFLKQRAIRICVSEEVKLAIEATGLVNGPVYTIVNGVDLDSLTHQSMNSRPGSVYILGSKQPKLALKLSAELHAQGWDVLCHDQYTPREQVLSAMASAEISVLLPHATEGFYLPALEAMALSELVVVPDCIGNRTFCHAGSNCLMPSLQCDALLAAVDQAAGLLKSGQSEKFRVQAQRTLQQHSLERERREFYQIIDNLDQIW